MDGIIKEEAGRKYYYLIEVLFVKEFIQEWKANSGNNLDLEKIAKRVHEYAINDA